MNNLFSFHGPAVKKLLGWRQGDEEEKWAEKAVDSLVKKLRKKKTANPGCVSKCVTIPKSLDGRLQVSHRKGLPHVIYCKVWRWPNLTSHNELKPIPDCLYPYDSKLDHICINPYHYQRIETSSSTSQIYSAITQQHNHPSIYHHPSNSSSHNYNSTVHYYNPSNSALPNNIPSPLEMPYPPYQSQSSHFFGTSPHSSGSLGAPSPSALSDDDDTTAHHYQNQIRMMYPLHTSPTNQPDSWCSIVYYELNTRVGQQYRVTSHKVTVDGFTNPSDSLDRICLGLLSNVNRNPTIDNTRRHIGRGVTLQLVKCNVTLVNNSEFPVFVQSRNSNYKMNLKPNVACRIPPGGNMEIFNTNLFLEMLNRAKFDGFNPLYDLQKMCYIRMSFAKGWGESYHRQDVTSTPCWIEIQLCKPLAHLDTALNEVEPPDHHKISSVS
uniref:Mothers against decapentaplegic homolog n=1 Tax=Rhabditophanes sp. KR3021 TaxID=114890 RepID=A0AC35UA34_9BILA